MRSTLLARRSNINNQALEHTTTFINNVLAHWAFSTLTLSNRDFHAWGCVLGVRIASRQSVRIFSYADLCSLRPLLHGLWDEKPLQFGTARRSLGTWQMPTDLGSGGTPKMVLGQSWSAAMRASALVGVLRKCDARAGKWDEVLNERSAGASRGQCQRLGGLDFSRYDGGPTTYSISKTVQKSFKQFSNSFKTFSESSQNVCKPFSNMFLTHCLNHIKQT